MERTSQKKSVSNSRSKSQAFERPSEYERPTMYTGRQGNRFSEAQLEDLKANFARNSNYVEKEGGKQRVMLREQFRDIMGLLGQNENPFLCDRIYDIFDEDRDGYIQEKEFVRIMDILCNGSDDERNQFSFRLMDVKNRGYIDFQEFIQYFTNIIQHWSSLINKQIKLQMDYMQEIFNTIDTDADGKIFCKQYSRALTLNPRLLDWFSILSQDRAQLEKTKLKQNGFTLKQMAKGLKKKLDQKSLTEKQKEKQIDQLKHQLAQAQQDNAQMQSSLEKVQEIIKAIGVKVLEQKNIMEKDHQNFTVQAQKYQINLKQKFEKLQQQIVFNANKTQPTSNYSNDSEESDDVQGIKGRHKTQKKVDKTRGEQNILNTLQSSDSLNEILNFDYQTQLQTNRKDTRGQIKNRHQNFSRIEELQKVKQRKSSNKQRFGKLVIDVRVSKKDQEDEPHFSSAGEGSDTDQKKKTNNFVKNKSKSAAKPNNLKDDMKAINKPVQDLQLPSVNLLQYIEISKQIITKLQMVTQQIEAVQKQLKSQKFKSQPSPKLTKFDEEQFESEATETENNPVLNQLMQLALERQKMPQAKDDKMDFVHIGNHNWNLVLHMLFGIRQSVVIASRAEDVYKLQDEDFKEKIHYDLRGISRKKETLFEFFDFCPKIFGLIRKFYHINSEVYLQSIGPEQLFGSISMGNLKSLQSQCSAGKSGSLFYYTSDQLFMLKTISHNEFIHFQSIMKSYYEHLLAYPHSMVARILGLHKIKLQRDGKVERIYFVIMSNVFNTTREITVKYDLKGSSQGRTSKKNGKLPDNPQVALKDNDWTDENMQVLLKKEVWNLVQQQLQKDAEFFQKGNINDYSILLGITHLKPGEAQKIIRESPKLDSLITNGIQNQVELYQLNQQSSSDINRTTTQIQDKERPEKAFFESQAGGLVSADGTKLYFMGIIDTLTGYGGVKKLENTFKSIVYDSKTISCIPPQQYGERFYNFMKDKVFFAAK